MKYPLHEEFVGEGAADLSEIASAMHALRYVMARGVDQPAEIQGLQKQQYWVLQALGCGPRRMSDLADVSQTSQASLTGIVDRLEEHGLVSRDRSSGDRRVVVVAATDEGLRVLAEAKEAFMRRLEVVVAPLDEVERKELLRLLRKLVPSRNEPTT